MDILCVALTRIEVEEVEHDHVDGVVDEVPPVFVFTNVKANVKLCITMVSLVHSGKQLGNLPALREIEGFPLCLLNREHTIPILS